MARHRRMLILLARLGLALAGLSGAGAWDAAHAQNTDATTQKPAAPAATPAPPANPEPPSAVVIDKQYARGLMGKEVRSAANEDMGRVIDVVVDRSGRVRAAVIDFGGFLGVGSRKIAVDWDALNFAAIADKRSVVLLALTRDQVKAAPEFKEGQPIVVLGAKGSLNPLPPLDPAD